MANAREHRRLALQSTAELARGLDILDKQIRQGLFASARETVSMMRAVVLVADSALVEYLRNTPLEADQSREES